VPTEVGVSVWVPLVGSVPLQLPDAVQLVALLDTQVIVVDEPTTSDVVAKFMLGAAGADAAVTVRVAAVGFEVPLALEQVSE